MKSTKWELPMFSPYNYTAMERRLEKRAREGWRLVKAERGGWLYRRMEPKELHYAVVYFPDASQFDPGPTEGQQTLRDYCLAAGWEPVTDWGQAQIYCNPQPDPAPIETEPSIQLQTIHKSMWRSFLPGELMLLALFLFQLWLWSKDLYWDPSEVLSSPSNLGSLSMHLLGVLMILVDAGGYFAWYLRSKRSIATGGGCVPATGHYRLVWTLVSLMGVALAAELLSQADMSVGIFTILHLLGMFVMIQLAWKLQSALKRRKFSRNANRIITLTAIVVLTLAMMSALMAGLFMTLRYGVTARKPVETYEAHGMTWNVYHDDIPLRIEDLVDTGYADWSTEAEIQSTPLATRTTYTQESRFDNGQGQPDLEYTVTDIHVPLLADYVWQGCLRSHSRYDDEWEDRRTCKSIEAAPWGADEAARLYQGDRPRDIWLVRWGSRMAEIRLSGFQERDMPQAAVIAEKLAP